MPSPLPGGRHGCGHSSWSSSSPSSHSSLPSTTPLPHSPTGSVVEVTGSVVGPVVPGTPVSVGSVEAVVPLWSESALLLTPVTVWIPVPYAVLLDSPVVNIDVAVVDIGPDDGQAASTRSHPNRRI